MDTNRCYVESVNVRSEYGNGELTSEINKDQLRELFWGDSDYKETVYLRRVLGVIYV